MAKKSDCVKLGLTCADVCEVLGRRVDGKGTDQVSQPILEATEKLTA